MMEKLKPKIVRQFIEKHGLCEDDIYSKIRTEIKVLKEFYEKNTVELFEDDDLAWMFFFGWVYILHYIYCATKKNEKNEEDKDEKNVEDKDKQKDEKNVEDKDETNNEKNMEDKDEFQMWNIKPDCLTFVKHDLFLLENQLPYQVLKLVISYLHTETQKETFIKCIENFILDSIKAQWEKHEKLLDHQPCQSKDPKHLLGLLRTKILRSVVKSPTAGSIVPQPINYLVEIMSEPLEKIKDLIEYIGKALENFPRKQTHYLQFCRNVEELKAAGIRLKPNNKGCVTDIDFNLGTLKIHPIKVDDTTASMFLNLIAYEMTPDFRNDFGISSYIAFLDSLIDRTQDVKELRDQQILRNILGSDEEVAQLFNEISTNLVPNPKTYLDVKKNIQKRYKNTWMTRIAQLNHLYFQSPWSIIAVLAAVAILAFTVVQTVYTTLGYYK